MVTCFSTFISGLGEFIAEQLKKDLDSVEISLLLDGLVVYRSNSPTEKVKHLRYLNNSFQLIKQFDNLGDDQSIEKMVDNFLDSQQEIPAGVGKSFRVMFYYANSPVAIDKGLYEGVENRILELTGGSGRKLIIDRANPDFEYWFLYRKEGYGFFGLRLTKHPDYKDILAKGQLRPELVAIMVLLSNPQKDDVILDPFAGSGAIPIERTKFPYQKNIAGDINPTLNWHSRSYTDTSMYRSMVKKDCDNKVAVLTVDALDMKEIADDSIDKIITDPPWGLYSAIEDIDTFYIKMLKEMIRVLKPGGLIVILVGRNVDMEIFLEQFTRVLELVKKFNILVSGKKAIVFVTKKT